MPNFSISHSSYNPIELQNHYQNLHGIKLLTFNPTDVTVLTVSDSPHLLIDEDFKAVKDNVPYTVCTKLGLVLKGGETNNPPKAKTKTFV